MGQLLSIRLPIILTVHFPTQRNKSISCTVLIAVFIRACGCRNMLMQAVDLLQYGVDNGLSVTEAKARLDASPALEFSVYVRSCVWGGKIQVSS